MDMSDKDGLAGENTNCDSVGNLDSVDTHEDWRISVSNPQVSHPLEEDPVSICHSSCSPPCQMMDPFRQNLWHEDGGFNVHTDAGTSNVIMASSNIDRALEMGWSMAQFPADPGFVERAAKFSFLGCGSFSEMMNQQSSLGVAETVGLFLQDTETASGSKLGDVGPPKTVKDRSNGSDDSQSNGHTKCNKRKRIGKDFETDESQRAQQCGEEEEEEEEDDKKEKDEKSPDSNGNKTNCGKQASDPLKDGYIHMRARRGQATNSHSLAERVRREKISERMKFLQDLVPGCDKVTGKAVMLDEIINYVQSLQRQIEFLSMKLSTVNPMLDFNLESLLVKDALQSSASTFPHNMSMLYPPPSYLSQTGFMQPKLSSVSPLNAGLKRQETHGYEGDLHMNHGTGAAPDREDTPGESKTPILSYLP